MAAFWKNALLLSLVAIGEGVSASPAQERKVQARSSYAIKNSHHVPTKWSRERAAPPDRMIALSIGLKKSGYDELEKHLLEVSDPSHPRYKDYLTPEEVAAYSKPTEDASRDVHEWLSDSGIDIDSLRYSSSGDWIKVSLPVEEVERLLDTKYSVYKHEDGSRLLRTPAYSLPRHLHEHIDTIQPTNSFSRPNALSRPKMKRSSTARPVKVNNRIAKAPVPQRFASTSHATGANISAVCDVTGVTPTCLRTLYNTIDYQVQVPGKNAVALTNYLGETNNRSDASIFLQTYRPEAAAAAYEFDIQIINNGDNQQTPLNETQLGNGQDVEGNLDAQTILGISWPTPLTAYNTGGSPEFIPDINTPTDTNEPYLTWLDYANSQDFVPQVISTSYDDDEQTVPLDFARRVCQEFLEFGVLGHSLLFASGDGGVGPTGACLSNDGQNRTQFLPLFPSSCPWITSVGATTNFDPEVAAFDPGNGFVTGAGFSNYFQRPAYQEAVIAEYITSLGGIYEGLYNTSGRAYPDLSGQGQRFDVIYDGALVKVDGTSASTPAVSAILSLVNDALLAVDQKPLGFLNPWLYGGGYEAFNDITSGNSMGCGTDGFPAQAGWDAATGWGTPDFKKILANLGVPFSANGTTGYRRRH
ncbi:MAG: hypothetical protein M1820_000140 [Bogoriella megaspora]|nr:MAG: hypothetical protein M1820_000140 [Bogoriella megaspora]